MDRRIDLAVAAGFLLAGLYVIIQAISIKQGLARDPVGPRAAFYISGGVMVVGALIVIVRNLMSDRAAANAILEAEGTSDEPGHPASAKKAAAAVAVCALYVLAFDPLGYLIATPIFIVALLAVLNERKWRSTVMIAVIFTALSYLTFAQVLGVRLPVGPFTDFFRAQGWIIL